MEFKVKKQGRWFYNNWSHRTLTVDEDRRCLFISKKGKAEQKLHGMLQPSMVKAWPYYDKNLIYQNHNSLEAQLSLSISGYAVAPSEGTISRQSSTSRVRTPSYSESIASRRGSLRSHPSTESMEGGDPCSWLIRCTSVEQLQELLAVLSRFMRVVEGTHLLVSRVDVPKHSPAHMMRVYVDYGRL